VKIVVHLFQQMCVCDNAGSQSSYLNGVKEKFILSSLNRCFHTSLQDFEDMMKT
jgi:hypothetical protein